MKDVLHEEWYSIPLESIPRKIQAVLQANVDPTLYEQRNN